MLALTVETSAASPLFLFRVKAVVIQDATGGTGGTGTTPTDPTNPSDGTGSSDAPLSITSVSGDAMLLTVGTQSTFTPKVTGSDATGLSFALNQDLPDGLAFDPATGRISGAPDEYATADGYVITVTASDGTQASTRPFSIDAVISQTKLTFASSKTAYGALTSVVSTIPLLVTDPVGAVTYSTVSATAGLAVAYDDAGEQMILSAATAGTYTLTVKAVDASARSATKTFTINVSSLTVSMDDQQWVQGTSTQLDFPTVKGSTGDNTYAYTGLPSGLTYDPQTGIVSATQTPAIGTYAASVSVSNAGKTSSDTFTLSVVDKSAIVWDPSAPTGQTIYQGDTYAFDLPVENAVGAVTYRVYYVSDNTLMSYAIDQTAQTVTVTGLKTGKPFFYVAGTDTLKRSTKTKVIRLTVLPPGALKISAPAEVAANQGAALNVALTKTNQIATLAYAKGAGNWPANFAVDPATGSVTAYDTISKTNRVTVPAGTYDGLTITATGTYSLNGTSVQQSAETDPFTIDVGPTLYTPAIVTPSKLVLGIEGAAVSWKPTATEKVTGLAWAYGGFTANYDLTQYGLTFDKSTGTVSGTPTKPFIIRDFTVAVTSQLGKTASTSAFWIGVQPKAALAVSPSQNANYAFKVGTTPSTDPIVLVANTFVGNITWAKLTTTVHYLDPATGAFTFDFVTYTSTGSWSRTIEGTDEFGRKVDFVVNYTVTK